MGQHHGGERHQAHQDAGEAAVDALLAEADQPERHAVAGERDREAEQPEAPAGGEPAAAQQHHGRRAAPAAIRRRIATRVGGEKPRTAIPVIMNALPHIATSANSSSQWLSGRVIADGIFGWCRAAATGRRSGKPRRAHPGGRGVPARRGSGVGGEQDRVELRGLSPRSRRSIGSAWKPRARGLDRDRAGHRQLDEALVAATRVAKLRAVG